MAEFGRVEVKSIKASEPRSNFPEAELEKLADQILNNQGLLRPIIVKQLNYETYQLLDGALTYYAAVRAYEKNPRIGEMVNAFIVGMKEDESLAQQQLATFDAALGRVSPQTPAVEPPGNGGMENQQTSSAWISSFETRLSDNRNEAASKISELDSRLKRVEKAIEKPYMDLLDIINSLPEAELLARLDFYGADNAKAQAICEARRNKDGGKFTSYEDLRKSTKGLAERGLIRLIDQARTHLQT